MASTFTDIGTELMTTGENAGNWGTKTNTNLQILEEAIAGYATQALTSGGTVTLTYTDGSVGDVARHAVIALTGALSGNAVVEVPSNEKIWIIDNQSTNAYTVTVRVNGQSGVTWGTSDKGTKILYANGTDVVDTNIGGGVGGHDLNGEELILDADADTSITADTDDQIDIKIAGADDFQFTANTFTAQSGSTIAAQALTATTVTASGIIKTDSTTAATSTTDGSLQTDGGLSVAADAIIGDDLKLLSDSAVLSFGADSDTTVTHTDGTGLTLNSTNKLCFNDASQFLQGSSATVLSIGATDEIDLTATAIDINGTCDISGTFSLAGTNITTTAAEINLIDGGTARGTTAVADGDGILINDAGTMRMTTVQTVSTYMAAESVGGSNIVTTGALNSGSITSGFGTIDTGSSTITTTGLISGGSLDIDNVLINGTTIGHTDDTDLLTVADGLLTVAGEISVTTLDIGGTNVTTTAAELNLIDGAASTGTTAVADADGILTNDGGTMRLTTAATFKTYFQSGVTASAIAADDISAGDGAVNLTTSSGDITIDAAANNSDIIFKGTDATSDITMLTLDGSEAGAATFNNKVVATELDISGNMDIDGTSNLDAVDIDGAVQLDATLTIGADDQGYDVILYGDTASANVTWDTSADDLIFNGAARIVVPDSGLVLGSTAVTSTAAELNKVDGAGTLAQAGKQTIWVPANAMTPTASNGCAALATVETTSGRPDMNVLDFDKDSDEFAQFAVAFPKSWNSGTVTYQFFWSGLAATTTVTLTLAGVSFADNDSIDTAYGTAVAVEDTAQGAVEECLVSAESGNVTIAGSPGDNELTYFRIGRDVSEDNMAGDCRLHGIKLFFTTDLANDA
jgi:hypothetical protein